MLPSILHRDERLMAVNKPSGWAVHPSRLVGDGPTLTQYFSREHGVKIYPLHRLDRPTSGLILLALDAEAASRYGIMMRDEGLEKEYLALVRGWTRESGEVDTDLPNDDHEEAAIVRALTRYERLASAEIPVGISRGHPSSRYSLVRARPVTGRYHQIRRHLRSISHPILGDTQHGDSKHNAHFRAHFGLTRLALHARAVAFNDPLTGTRRSFTCPWPEDLERVSAALGMPSPEERDHSEHSQAEGQEPSREVERGGEGLRHHQ